MSSPENVSPRSFAQSAIIYAAGAGTLAGLGYLGGRICRWIVPSVVPSAYALALGLTVPSAVILYSIASKIRNGETINITFSAIGGYTASIVATNYLGFSVSLIGPFLGVGTTIFTGALVVSALAPIAIVASITTNAFKRVRDYVLHGSE